MEVRLQHRNQVGNLETNIDKHIKRVHLRDVYGNETTVAVVNQKVAFKRLGGEVIDTARAVGDVTHDDSLHAAKALQNVADGTCIHQQALWELQRDPFRPTCADAPKGLVDFEVVVRGQALLDCFIEVRIVHNIIGDLIPHKPLQHPLCSSPPVTLVGNVF